MDGHFYLKPLLVGMLLIAACCNDTPFDNPLDPASKNYIQPFDPAKGILIEDFDDGNGFNLLGLPNSFFRSPDTIRVDALYIRRPPENLLRRTGGALQIKFNVTSPDSAFGGWRTTLRDNRDPSPLNLKLLNLHALTFWVKADAQGINLEVGLRDATHESQKGTKECPADQTCPKVIRQLETFWQKASIPISTLSRQIEVGGLDSTRVREINFSVGHQKVGPLFSGTIYLDEIAFER